MSHITLFSLHCSSCVAGVSFSLPVSEGAGMSSQAYQDIVSGPLASYIALSGKIGGDVAAHAKLVSEAFR